VETIDDAVKGIVRSIHNNMVVILTEDDFEMHYLASELVVVDNAFSDSDLSPSDIATVISEKETKKPNPSKRIKPKERQIPAMEVDLHIHKLVNRPKSMSNYDMLTIQLETARRQLDFAISKRIQRIVFIHGVGDGVLRADLESLFRRYENVKYYDADFKKYGRGATEVYIFQSKVP